MMLDNNSAIPLTRTKSGQQVATMVSLIDLTVQNKYFVETIRRWTETQLRDWLKDLSMLTQFQIDRFTGISVCHSNFRI